MKRSRFLQEAARLDALSPLAVLTRGYAALLDESGTAIRSVKALAPETEVQLRLSDGVAKAKICEVKEYE